MALVFVAASGHSPSAAASAFWEGAFGDRTAFATTLEQAIPLMFVALAWIIAFNAGRFHVGFPGQIMVAGTVIGAIALTFSAPRVVQLPLAIVGGMIGGAAYAGVMAWLWARFGVNEILSSLLLNFIAFEYLAWIVRGPLQEPMHVQPSTDILKGTARWPILLTDTSLKWDLFLVPFLVVGMVFLLKRTRLGMRIRMVGASEPVARHAGVRTVRMGVYAMLISGALAGLAASSLLLAGDAPEMTDDFESFVGFHGIAVALLARNSPIGVIPAAILFSALTQGSTLVEALVGVSSAVADITQGIVILLVLSATTILYFLRSSRRGIVRTARAPEASVSRPEAG